MTTFEKSRNHLFNENDQTHGGFGSSDTEDTENEIPYHAREHARPFTYGKMPKGFKKSDLNHVHLDDMPDTSKAVPVPQSSPSALRKAARPSVSPSRPVLRKTPSRQEFEEMLRERREQSMRQQNHALKEAQNASIQKDLDALQEKLNKRALLLRSAEEPPRRETNDNPCREVVKLVETIDLPDEKTTDDQHYLANAIVEAPRKYEPAPSTYEPTLVISEVKRPETPAFPVSTKPLLDDRCVSPYPMTVQGSPILQRSNSLSNKQMDRNPSAMQCPALPSTSRQFRPTEHSSPETPHDVAPHLVKFVRDSSQFWYKPHMTREEAVAILKPALPGAFIIRNSTTYKDAFGLVLRVAKPPKGVPMPENIGNSDVLVRHFLLEPTTRGVRLKGCVDEPTFTSLSALVYQHSINQLALPCKLNIPNRDLMLHLEGDGDLIQRQKQLLEQGAACNVLYLFSMNMESLTGDEAIRRAVHEMYAQPELAAPIEVHFKVSCNGITLTDNKRRMFFRRHYAPNNISHIGVDPDNRFFSVMAVDEGLQRMVNKTIYAFVARNTAGSRDNQCHVFCDLAATQPASAIVSFAQKILVQNKNVELL